MKQPFYTIKTKDECTDKELWKLQYYQVFYHSFSNSTGHGVSFMIKGRGWLRRLGWLLAFLTGVALLLYNFAYVTMEYNSFNVYVNRELIHFRDLSFPAVTVCNTNPVKQSKLHLSPTLSSLVSSWEGNIPSGKKKRRKRSAASCTTAVTSITNSCFWKVSSSSVTFTAAQTACQSDGGDLARVQSQEIRTFLDNNNFFASGHFFWIGLEKKSNVWTWNDGTTVGWDDWAPSNPTGDALKTCVLYQGSGKWQNTHCTESRQYLCEYTQPATTTTTTASTTTTTSAAGTTTPASVSGASALQSREEYREDFLRESDVIAALANEPEAIRKELGYTFGDLVLECNFKGQPCAESDFGYVFDMNHGNCFIFNSGWNWGDNKTHFSVHNAGPSQGLSLMVNIQQAEYVNGISKAAGAIVVIHPHTRMPFPEDEGSFALPGHRTSIGIKKVIDIKMGGKFGQCEENTQQYEDIYQQYFPVIYHINACYKTCYQKYVINTCGCADPAYPMKGTVFGTFNGTACSLRNTYQDECLYNMSQKYTHDELQCDCPNACRDETYSVVSSKSTWPATNSYNSIISEHGSSFKTQTINESFVYNNLLQVEIYYDDLNMLLNEQLPDYEIGKFLADVANIMVLYVGCTVLTFCELLEFIIDITLIAILRSPCFSKKRIKDINQENGIEDSQSTLQNDSSHTSEALNYESDEELKGGTSETVDKTTQYDETRVIQILPVNGVKTINSAAKTKDGVKTINSAAKTKDGVKTINSAAKTKDGVKTINSAAKTKNGEKTINSAAKTKDGVKTINSAAETKDGVKTIISAAETKDGVNGVKTINSAAETKDGVKTINSAAETKDGVKTITSAAETKDGVNGVKTINSAAETKDGVKTINSAAETKDGVNGVKTINSAAETKDGVKTINSAAETKDNNNKETNKDKTVKKITPPTKTEKSSSKNKNIIDDQLMSLKNGKAAPRSDMNAHMGNIDPYASTSKPKSRNKQYKGFSIHPKSFFKM